jgi:molybdopterin molybdotransferase
MPPLLPVTEALNRLLNAFQPLETVLVPLKETVGRILAADIRAETDLPLFDNSSMDGFALLASDVTQACATAPVTLKVVDDIPAGKMPSKKLRSGEAARIMTGAPLPAGADAVIPVEETDHNKRTPGSPPPATVQIFKKAQLGENVRKRGDDIRKGANILSRGQNLRAQDLGMLAMLGISQVPVTRKPRVALLSSGDELTPLGESLSEGKIYDVNSYTLHALLESAGCEVIPLGAAADTPQSILQALEKARNADLILSSAGVSMGSFDFIKDTIEKNGKLNFWRINMRPGKPLTFGNYKKTPFIGLAGNPVSAFVGFMVFVRPVIEKMLGSAPQAQRHARVRLAEPVQSDGRESYLRAIVYREENQLLARLTGHQGAGNLFSMVQANALLIVPAGIKSLPQGAEITAWLLE